MNNSIKLVTMGIRFADADERSLLSSGCDLRQYDSALSFEEALQAAADAEAVCLSNIWVRHLPADFVNRLQKCRLLVVSGGAAGILDTDFAAMRGISVANCSSYAAPAIAEYAFALLLALARKLARKGERPSEPGLAFQGEFAQACRGLELRGKTLGIAGYGPVGWNLVRLATGFGMNVLVTKRNRPWWATRFLWRRNARFVKFDEMISKSDAIISVQSSGVRRGFSPEVFSRMRRGCLFVNVGGRFGVDEEALRVALESGILGGAGLDVFTPACAQALRGLKNVILSPHMAWNTAEAAERLSAECAKNVVRFFSGRPINLVVDASRKL